MHVSRRMQQPMPKATTTSSGPRRSAELVAVAETESGSIATASTIPSETIESATAAILLTLGVGKNIAINFSLASGLLIASSASLAALCGTALSITTLAVARRRAASHAVGVT